MHSLQRRIGTHQRGHYQHPLEQRTRQAPIEWGERIGNDVPGVSARPQFRLRPQLRIGSLPERGQRARLDDPEARSVPDPLDVVTGVAVVQCGGGFPDPLGELLCQCRIQYLARCQLGGRIELLGAAVFQCHGPVGLTPEAALHEHQLLVSHALLEAIFVSFGQSADQGFAQTPVGMNDPLVREAPNRIGGEGHPGGNGPHQRHHHDRHGRIASRRLRGGRVVHRESGRDGWAVPARG